MPKEITDGYELECFSCGYIWKTKYAKIPAKCPSCNTSIYNTNNYKIKTHFVHNELTPEEKEELTKRILVWISLFILFIFLIFITGFWIALILFITFYYLFKHRKKLLKNKKPKGQRSRGWW